ncbi:MAG: AraC family transcriptional regulator [Acidobacteriota bacterium]
MKPVFAHVGESEQSFFRVNGKMGYRAKFLWHFHDVYELNLIIRGKGTRFVGDHIGDYQDGDLVLMGPKVPHTWYGDPRLPAGRAPHDSIGIQFVDTLLGDGVLHLPGWQHIGRMLSLSARGIDFNGRTRHDAARRMVELPGLKGPLQLAGFLEILDLLGSSREFALLSSEGFNPRLHEHTESRIDRVCSYILQEYTQPLQLEELAGLANLSVSGFCHLFRTTTGRTLTAYVNELRVGLACKLLLETDATISEVAMSAGFNNLSNFNRRFLKLKKMNPREFRKKYLQGEGIV